jgi:hypothetical protein
VTVLVIDIVSLFESGYFRLRFSLLNGAIDNGGHDGVIVMSEFEGTKFDWG